ncbi:hypothetical protein [Modestobacter versicolor]|uniref:hypothetical protein n=1 Tax=Modestobacter versicolor TaxID=429133 RepID=UPI0034DFEA56
MDDVDAAFRAFVTARRPDLLGTALLLTGDRAAAEELVQRALRRARRCSPADRDTAVLRSLAAGATSRWGRLARAEQVIEEFPAAAVPGPAGPDLATALRGLAPVTRAVVVLRWHEGLGEERTAALLHRTVPEVAAEAARGLAQLRAALAPSVFERAGAERPLEERLAGELARLAAASGRWRLTAEESLTDLAVRRTGARRRLAAGAVAAACLAGVAVPLARWAPDPPAEPATLAVPAVAAPRPVEPALPAVPVLTGPARGSLAGDEPLLAALRTVGWGSLEAPPPAEREVVLAADTPHGRVALVVGTVLEDFRGVWLTGPVGARPEELVPQVPRQLGRGRPVSLLLGGPGAATLVVVTAPGDVIAVSPRLMTGPRGTVGRTYTPVGTADGLAVVPATTTRLGPALSVRVTREGREVYRSGVDWRGADPAAASVPELSSVRPGPGTPDPQVVAAALTDLAVPLGVEPAALQPELLWSAGLPLTRGTGTVAVLVARSPGGALVVTTRAGVGGSGVTCGTQTPAGTTEVASLTIARVCDVALPGLGQTDDGRWLVVTAPPEAFSAEVLDGAGRLLDELRLTDGSAVASVPEGARTLRTRDAAGRELRETPVAPPPPGPFGDFGTGPAR